jgi:uncharacterized protein (TIGR03086 family)
MDPLDLFDRGTAWAADKIPAASAKLENTTPCEEWTVRTLLNHMLDTQRYFTQTAKGESAEPPGPNPPDVLDGNPTAQYDRTRREALDAFGQTGVIEKTGPSLGIAFCDQLVHGWDLATATGQDATMPSGLAEAAFSMLDGRLTDDRRGNAFGPALPVDDGASAQERLLAYVGRKS